MGSLESMRRKQGEGKGVCYQGVSAVACFQYGEIILTAECIEDLSKAFRRLCGVELDLSLVVSSSIFASKDVKVTP